MWTAAAQPVAGDVAIDGGVIAAVGAKAGAARQVIADELTVTPGFIDIHTHLDAQIGWDPLLAPTGRRW